MINKNETIHSKLQSEYTEARKTNNTLLRDALAYGISTLSTIAKNHKVVTLPDEVAITSIKKLLKEAVDEGKFSNEKHVQEAIAYYTRIIAVATKDDLSYSEIENLIKQHNLTSIKLCMQYFTKVDNVDMGKVRKVFITI